MKNYKRWIPLLLIGFIIVAIYARSAELTDKQQKYDTHLEDARQYRSEKIYVDAWAQYNQALEMQSSYELCLEMADMLLEQNDSDEIKKWGDYLITTYPKDVRGYEYLINQYYEEENYDKCFALYEIVQKRELDAPQLTVKMNTIKYAYKLGTGGVLSVSEFVGDYCLTKEDGMYIYLKSDGKKLLESEYYEADVFSEDLAPVCDRNGEYYFIDLEGNRKLNPPKDIEITSLGCYSEDFYTVGTQEKMYYANKAGEIVLGPYEDATTFNYERAAIKEDGLWYLIDMQGNKLSDGYLSFVTDDKHVIYRNQIIFAQAEDGYVCLNGEGKEITKQRYEDAKMFLDGTLAAVKLNGKWGYIDNTAKIMIEPQYEDAKSFRNGLAAVKIADKWGYIDAEGVIAIEPIFADANSFNLAGYTFVQDVDTQKWILLQLIGSTYAQ